MHSRDELTRRAGFHQVAIDGKQVHWFKQEDPEHPGAQPHFYSASGELKGSTLRVLRATHVGQQFSTCIHQMPIPKHTNEIGALPAMLTSLKQAYGNKSLVGLISADAGLCSCACAQQIRDNGWEYLLRLKETQATLLEELRRGCSGESLGRRRYREHGKSVELEVWVHSLGESGWLHWGHARSLVRIVRVCIGSDGEEVSRGERMWVSSLSGLDVRDWAAVCKGHWGCENGQHMVADKHFGEDRRASQWSKNAEGLLVVSVLRAMAMNILNVVRSCREQGYERSRSYREARSEVHVVMRQAAPRRDKGVSAFV
jgi:predicted transposase YbfD/YdcC